MKINITKKQYWDLMRGMYMADWMANAICEADIKQDEGIKEARDFIFSLAREFGYENFVEYDDEYKKYYATSEMDDESSIRELIERYDEYATWNELSKWLGERDFFAKYTSKEIEIMNDEDRFTKRMECEILWEKEFEEYGIERISLDIIDDFFKKWHKIKDSLINSSSKVFFHEREIWWCSIGRNIGFEQNGKGDEFTRPVIIIKRLSLDTCLIIPLTTSNKRKNIFSLGILTGEIGESFAMVEQIRLIDAKRLGKKITVLDKERFDKLISFIKGIISSDT
ncbi:MAG: type II toxin-antitoxin system PemK/MazF family toxin [Patescibacteria group bacterium]